MPELPDLQVFSANLNKTLKGKTITKVDIPVTQKLNVSAAELKKALTGQSIKKVYREGKQLHISFSNDDILALHLMLNGNMHLFEKTNHNKHTILALSFDDDTGLALTDWQSAATVTLNPEPNKVPDALSKEIDFQFLKELLQTRTAIKKLLLDQKKLRGIGNAYADEILWDAGIAPSSISNKIPDDYVKALEKSIKKVLTDAEKQILKTNPDIISGEVRDFMIVHNFKKTHTPTGALIKHETTGGRKTYYTDEQILFQ